MVQAHLGAREGRYCKHQGRPRTANGKTAISCKVSEEHFITLQHSAQSFAGERRVCRLSREQIRWPWGPGSPDLLSIHALLAALVAHYDRQGSNICWDRPIPIMTDTKCEEAGNYPLYDPSNPDHNPAAPLVISVDEYPSPPRRSRSPSPQKIKSRIQGLADTIRAKATFFYAIPELQPETPSSTKSASSRKSVRFRSNHSVIDGQHASPISIPDQTPLLLPTLNIAHNSLMLGGMTNDDVLGLTARPPRSLPGTALTAPSQHEINTGLDVAPESPSPRNREQISSLLTPMPGTNLPLEDPFDDIAAVDPNPPPEESYLENPFEDLTAAELIDTRAREALFGMCAQTPSPTTRELEGFSSLESDAPIHQTRLNCSRIPSDKYDADSEQSDSDFGAAVKPQQNYDAESMHLPTYEELYYNQRNPEIKEPVKVSDIVFQSDLRTNSSSSTNSISLKSLSNHLHCRI